MGSWGGDEAVRRPERKTASLTAEVSDLCLFLASWKGPVCTLAPHTAVPAMHFPWADIAPSLASW